MFKNLYYLNSYAQENSMSSTLELPVGVGNKDILSTLNAKFEKYYDLLECFFEERLKCDSSFCLSHLRNLQDSFICILEKKEGSYENLKNVLDSISKEYKSFLIRRPIEAGHTFFRFCSYSSSLSRDKEFYHCPALRNATDTRFGNEEKHYWYLGYSKDVCKCEARGRVGSLATFKLKAGTETLFIIDFTQKGLFDESNLESEEVCYIIWWLIASCYCFTNEETSKETYIIPQMISRYIEENMKDVSGIRYYTVRNEKLDPFENTYVNIALFTNNYNDEGYDLSLCEKFEMIDSEQNVTTK